MPRSSTSPIEGGHGDGSHASASKPKRTSACLHCRRQKLKCDGTPNRTCTRCRDDGVECIVRPRANAAILADDLRWQQSVEFRLQSLTDEIATVKAANADLVRQLGDGGGGRSVTAPAGPPSHQTTTTPGSQLDSRPHPLPQHLHGLRDILRPALAELQHPTNLDVAIEDATVLWEHFYDSLAIYHGFTASTELATPSPLLFSAVVTASAKRFTGHLATPVERWEELFQRALIRLLYITVPKTWDDVVGLGIARTWWWKADEMTAGLAYGAFVETATGGQNSFRDRRVWDFLELTTISHGILHLSTPIVPDCPPRGVPDRTTSHVFLMALNELFDSLGVVNRALTTPRSLVMLALYNQPVLAPLTYAEVHVLRVCRTDLDRWCPKWQYEIQNADAVKLPTGSDRDFLINLVGLYYHVALFVIDAYLNQGPQPDTQQYEASARDLLNLVVGKWADSLHMWPKLFLHSALIAALAVSPEEPLVRRAHDLFVSVSNMLHTSGSKLLQRLVERCQAQQGPRSAVQLPMVFTPIPDIDMAMAYTGSDSFWSDLSGMLGLPQGEVLVPAPPAPPPHMVPEQGSGGEVPWPRQLSGWNSGVGRMGRNGSL